MRYKKAIVTGGAGFIGSHIAKQLVSEGLEVIILDNLTTGRKSYVPKGAKLKIVDILNLSQIQKYFSNVDIVFHQAAKVSIRSSKDNFLADANINIIGTLNVIKAMVKHKVPKLVYASSMAVYGETKRHVIDETDPLQPISCYGLSKLTGEKYALLLSQQFGFSTVILRYFNTYGIRQTFTPYVGVITIFIQQLLQKKIPVIYGTGNQIRDFVSVDDVTRANILAMNRAKTGSIYNIGSGVGLSVNEVYSMLTNEMKLNITPVFKPKLQSEVSTSIANITLARKEIGYNPQFKLEKKIIDIIEWNKKN